MSDVQLGIKITADGSKAVASLNQVSGGAAKLNRDIGALSSGWAKLNDQFAKQTAAKAWSEQLGQASQAAQKLKQSTENAAAAWAKLSQQGMKRLEAGAWAEKLSVDTAKTTHAIKALDAQIDRTRRGIAVFGDSGLAATRGIQALSLAAAGFAAIASTKALFEAARDMERLNGMMSAASGGSQASAANLQFVTDTANRLGISMTGAADAFAQLTASAQGTALQGQATRDIFQAVAQASAALGKSSYDTAGMLTAISQMMSKGKVSAEELRGQLGERLPGAFNLAAKAMGVSTQTLDEMLTKGEIMAADFLPRFAKVLDETYSQARFDRLNNEVARLDNAWTQFKRNLTDTSGFKSAIETLTGLLTGMNSVLEKSKQYGSDAFKIMPNRADVARALAGGQTGLDPNTAQAATAGAPGGRASTPLGIAQQFQGMTERGNAEALTRFLNEHSGTVFNNLTVPWCARFVNASLDKAGIKGTGSAAARSFETFGKGIWQRGMSKDALADVQPGDIAVFTRKGGGHVGFVKAIDPTKGLLEILGGNQSNSVSVAKRSMQDLIAVRRPPVPGAKGEYEDFDKYQKRAQKEREDAQREAEKRQRDATQRYINNLDDQAKAAQRQSEITISGIDTQISALDRERDAWDKSQQDKIEAAKGNYDAMARLEAERAATLQDYAGRELALIQRQFDARKQAMEAAAAAFRKQLDSPNKLTDDEERRAKQSLADVQADLVKLANERAQAEAKAGQAAMEANRGGMELAQKQRAFIANINADLEFQKQLYLQLKAAKEAGATPEGLAVIRATAEYSRQLPGMVSQAEIQLTEQAIAQQKIYEQQLDEITQTQNDRAESVREQQLRENAYWDQLINRMEQYADTWREITGSQNDAFSRLAIQTNQYAKSIEQIGNAYEDLNKRQGDPAGVLGIAEGAAQAQSALNMMAQTMIALRSQYKEGTQGYEDMTSAAERMMEVQRALQLVEAVLGVVHQATAGDPYTAIPRMIGVAAMMASMGLQTGAGGSANASVKYAAQAGQQDSGVFGDPSKASDSIAKSLELIRDNSSNDLNYSAAMLRALEGIEAAMKGVTNTVIRGLTPASVSGLGSKVPEGLNTFNKVMNTMFFGPAGFFAADFLNKALAPLTKILFNVTRKISDFGIAASQQALSDILTKGFSGQVYTDIETTTKMLGITVSKSVKTAFSDLDPTIAREFTRAFASIRRAIIEGGKAFDLTAADFNQRLKGFVVDMGKISTKDLTGEQLQEKITQMFNEQSDRIARRFMPKLGPFQQVGEGYFYTFTRVAEAVNRAGGELERLGITAINFRDVVDKQAPDIAAEIFRQSVIQAEGMSSVAALMQNASGTLQEMKDYFTNLIEIRQSLRTAGLGEIMSEAMINRAGGADAFAQSLNVYLEEFLTPSERLIGQWQNIGDAFTALGLKMPTTNAEFRTLVESIDVSTEAGQKLRGAVIGLAPAFADLTSAMNDAMSALQDAYNTAKEQSKSLHDYLASLKTGDMASGSPMDRYNAAKARFEDLKTRAAAGDQSAIDAIQGAASEYLNLSKQIFAGTAQYAADVASVERSIGSLADVLDAQIAEAKRQVPALENNTGALNSLSAAMATYTDTMRKVGEVISGQQINGQSINDINAGNNQGDADAKAKAAKEAEAVAFEQRLAEMTRDLRYAREHGQDNKADKIKADIEAYIAQIQASGVFSVAWDGKRHDVSYRAKGGYTPPGWTVVGEQGPELVNFSRPAQVYTAAQTREALRPQDDGKTFAALEAIKDEMRALVLTQSGANPAIIGELQALRARLDQLERNQRMKA